MSDSYFVDFTAFIDERKRPENFPHKVHDKQVLNNVESTEHLQLLVNDRFVRMVSSSGLVVLKDENEIQDQSKINFNKRVFVPWHMITHMVLDVYHIPAKLGAQDPIIPPGQEPEPSIDLVN